MRHWILYAGLAALVGVATFLLLNIDQQAKDTNYVALGGKKQPEFTLQDHQGHEVSLADYGNDLKLVYFGYTFCPDVCQIELANITTVLNQLGDNAEHVDVLFISIDPERDTPDRLASYVSHFHPQITGLTGSDEQLADAAKPFGAFFERVEHEGYYLMNHTSLVYLLGPDNRMLGFFRHNTPPATMVAALKKHL